MTPADLRAIRKSLGLSQTALARLLGVRPEHVSRAERGEKGLSEPARRYILALRDGYRPADWPS